MLARVVGMRRNDAYRYSGFDSHDVQIEFHLVNDVVLINGDGGNENDETYLVRKGMLMMMPVMRPPMTETASEIPRTVIWIPAWFSP